MRYFLPLLLALVALTISADVTFPSGAQFHFKMGAQFAQRGR